MLPGAGGDNSFMNVESRSNMGSRSSRMSRRGHHQESELEESNKDFYDIGKNILENVSRGPQQTRMGDIYHSIKETVDKMAG